MRLYFFEPVGKEAFFWSPTLLLQVFYYQDNYLSAINLIAIINIEIFLIVYVWERH